MHSIPLWFVHIALDPPGTLDLIIVFFGVNTATRAGAIPAYKAVVNLS